MSSFAPKALGNTLAWFATTATPFVVTALIFRRIGEEAYGLWATVVALRAILLLLDSGLSLGVSRDAALMPQLAREAAPTGKVAPWARIRAAWRLHLGLAVAATLLGIAAAGAPAALLGLTGRAADVATTIAVLTALEAACTTMGTPLLAILRGRQRFSAVAVTASLQAVLGIALVLLTLTPYGLVGAAASLLAARAVVQWGLFAWMRRRGMLNRPDGAGDPRPNVRAVTRFAVPLWIASLGMWLGQMADVPLVGALFGDEAAGHCALGVGFATACAGLLFAVLGAAFPRFVVARAGKRAECMGAVLFLGCTLAAAGFGLVIAARETILTHWVGTAPLLAAQVLVLYSLMWAANAPAHVLSSMTIAASHHRILNWVTLAAVALNVCVSAALALGGYPLGPAIGSLGAIVITNWWLLPKLALDPLELRWAQWARPTAAGYGVGAAIALTASAVLHGLGPVLGLGSMAALGLAIIVTLGLCGIALDLTVRNRSTLHLCWVRWRRGGFAVLRRQKAQAHAMAEFLATEPRAPTVLAKRPLVTIRIATYNRGPLVAERALASAIAQTYDNIEIIVVGDCCDEATARAVRSVDDPRIRFVNLPERGRYPNDPKLRWMVAGSTPMNHGVELARGEWIAPLDDDDEFTPDHVEIMLKACLERNLDFAWGIAESERSDGTWAHQGSWPLQRGAICHSAVFYSTRLAAIRHDLDAWRLDDPGDWNLWSRFAAAGAQMGFVEQVVTRHYEERRDVVDPTPWWMAAERGPTQPRADGSTPPATAVAPTETARESARESHGAATADDSVPAS